MSVRTKTNWLGQMLGNEILLRDIIEGRMNGKAYRGKKGYTCS